jgi:hypothetical protein
VALLCGVAAIALGLDTGLLTRLSLADTAKVEQTLLDKIHPMPAAQAAPSGALDLAALPVEGQMPALDGAIEWINSAPLQAFAFTFG